MMTTFSFCITTHTPYQIHSTYSKQSGDSAASQIVPDAHRELKGQFVQFTAPALTPIGERYFWIATEPHASARWYIVLGLHLSCNHLKRNAAPDSVHSPLFILPRLAAPDSSRSGFHIPISVAPRLPAGIMRWTVTAPKTPLAFTAQPAWRVTCTGSRFHPNSTLRRNFTREMAACPPDAIWCDDSNPE